MDPKMETKSASSSPSSSLIPPGFASSLGEMYGRARDKDKDKTQSIHLALERADRSGSLERVDVEMFAVCSAHPRNQR